MIPSLLKKNLSIIIRLDILDAINTFGQTLSFDTSEFEYKEYANDKLLNVSRFYKDNGRNDFTIDFLKDEYKQGASFHSIEIEGRIVSGMLIHTGYVYVNAPSFLAFQEKNDQGILLDNDTIYSSHNIVDPSYRGKHLYSMLLYKVLEQYKMSKKNYLLMTGADNSKMLKSSFEHHGEVIGIIESTVFAKTIKKRKVYYENIDKRCWSCVNKK